MLVLMNHLGRVTARRQASIHLYCFVFDLNQGENNSYLHTSYFLLPLKDESEKLTKMLRNFALIHGLSIASTKNCILFPPEKYYFKVAKAYL